MFLRNSRATLTPSNVHREFSVRLFRFTVGGYLLAFINRFVSRISFCRSSIRSFSCSCVGSMSLMRTLLYVPLPSEYCTDTAERPLHICLIHVRTNQQTDRWIIVLGFQQVIYRIDIEVQFTGKLRFKSSRFQFTYHIATQANMVEKQINFARRISGYQFLLPAYERKPVPTSSNRSVTLWLNVSSNSCSSYISCLTVAKPKS